MGIVTMQASCISSAPAERDINNAAPSLTEIAQECFSLLHGELDPEKLKRCQAYIGRFLEWYGDQPLEELTPQLWQSYRQYLARGDKRKEYAPQKSQLIDQHEVACQKLFRHAVSQGWLPRNPIGKRTTAKIARRPN